MVHFNEVIIETQRKIKVLKCKEPNFKQERLNA